MVYVMTRQIRRKELKKKNRHTAITRSHGGVEIKKQLKASYDIWTVRKATRLMFMFRGDFLTAQTCNDFCCVRVIAYI